MAQTNKKNKEEGQGVKLRDLHPPRNFKILNEFWEYIALAFNAIKITCKDPYIKFGYKEKKFVKQQLIFANQVGFDRLTNMWAKCYGYGLNEYWQPERLTFIFPNSRGYTRQAYYEPSLRGAYLIQGYPGNITLADIIQKATDIMQVCDESIIQNLEACKTPHYVTVKDENTRLSLLQAIRKRQTGEPVIMLDETLGDSMKGIANLTEFIAPDIYEYKMKVRDELLNKLATLTANINKKERVQVGEVNAIVGQCEDFIYSMIDNVNEQCEDYGLPFEMGLNTSLEELYVATAEDDNLIEEGKI